MIKLSSSDLTFQSASLAIASTSGPRFLVASSTITSPSSVPTCVRRTRGRDVTE
jgi:hypothetical protein